MSYGVLILDPQYDNLSGGSINAFGSAKALTNIISLIANADLVVSTRDQHPTNHFSFSDDPKFTDGSWPLHCVEGTKGARIFPAIRKKSDYIISKGRNRNPPDEYSAFVAKKLRPIEDLIDILKRHPVDTMVVCGFLFEIGVQFTAFDANALGFWDVIVPKDCCGTLINDAGIQLISEKMGKAGISVVDNITQIEI